MAVRNRPAALLRVSVPVLALAGTPLLPMATSMAQANTPGPGDPVFGHGHPGEAKLINALTHGKPPGDSPRYGGFDAGVPVAR